MHAEDYGGNGKCSHAEVEEYVSSRMHEAVVGRKGLLSTFVEGVVQGPLLTLYLNDLDTLPQSQRALAQGAQRARSGHAAASSDAADLLSALAESR